MNLEEFFKLNPKAAIAFSGGVDSAYLMYAASHYAEDTTAYYVKSQFQPEFEFNDAVRLADEIGVSLRVINLNVLSDPQILANPADRCYYCKQVLFKAIIEAAAEDGFELILDGTNASDEEGDRPGMRALRELKVKSPLRECALTKQEIRKLSREAGLFTWNKPSYACLATRIPTGQEITKEKLEITEKAEAFLFSLGFKDFRVRMVEDRAKIQVGEDQLEMVFRLKDRINSELKKYYSEVLLDLQCR